MLFYLLYLTYDDFHKNCKQGLWSNRANNVVIFATYLEINLLIAGKISGGMGEFLCQVDQLIFSRFTKEGKGFCKIVIGSGRSRKHNGRTPKLVLEGSDTGGQELPVFAVRQAVKGRMNIHSSAWNQLFRLHLIFAYCSCAMDALTGGLSFAVRKFFYIHAEKMTEAAEDQIFRHVGIHKDGSAKHFLYLIVREKGVPIFIKQNRTACTAEVGEEEGETHNLKNTFCPRAVPYVDMGRKGSCGFDGMIG